MTEGSADNFISLPAWLVRLCKWCWRGRRFLFGTVILGIVLNIAAALPLTAPSTLHTLPIAWLFSHLFLLVCIFVLLLLLTILCGLIARLSAPLSERQLLVRYLEWIRRDTELATLKGIPAGLIAESVRLTDIYIPPRFYLNRARVDFPVSDDDLARYHQALKKGSPVPDLERAVLEAETNWLYMLQQDDQVGLDVVWEQISNNDAVVIQGYPGMGKSTLMERLALYMATCGLHQSDPKMPAHKKLTPVLIPILLRLGNYARALVERADLSLSEYLYCVLDEMNLPGLATLMQQNLLDGLCLVMLDGLDEVSEPTRREQVQREIRNLVGGNYHCCRFVITSRVAGYDQAAFPEYPHFILAELTEAQIDSFLLRWCGANFERERVLRSVSMDKVSINREAKRRARELRATIKDNPSVYELAKSPLLLTLLLVMQQNSIVLPRQRVELYDTVTKTLLENRNISKGLKEVPEFQAIERLGPLAFQMQEAGRDLVRQRDVEEALMAVICREGGTEEQVRTEAQHFLQRVRERGGLFVSRVGDYFGFMHRTFQEYFAARYFLNQIKADQQHWISELVQRARRQDALWREPFLLAVAYQSKENEHIASEILRKLLADASVNSFEQEISVVLLSANAIIEAKPLTLQAALQQETAERLLICYEKALQADDIKTCELVEDLMGRWLYSLPKEAYRLPLLDVISQAIKDTQQIARQRAVLTLLVLIARKLVLCSGLVFKAIIPPLLALTNLPAIYPYSPTADLAITPDFDVADLAVCVLSFLGKSDSAGLYLKTVRDYFEKKPDHLRLLAQYSLERGKLITPTAVPLAEKNYRHYKDAMEKWLKLREAAQNHITEQHIQECFTILQSLLACAEDACYPVSHYLLNMLERSEAQTEQPWSEVWQTYLLERLNIESYTEYRETALLWTALFSEEQLQPLVDNVRKHYVASDFVRKRYAQRLISYFSSYLWGLRGPNYYNEPIHIMDLVSIKDVNYTIGFIAWERLLDERDGNKYKILIELRTFGYWSNLRNSSTFYSVVAAKYLGNINRLSESLITKDTIEMARVSLSTARKAEKIDLLTILQGRMLQFQRYRKMGSEVETEVQLIARAVVQELTIPNVEDEVQKAASNMLKSLPARTVTEIAFIWSLLDDTQDEQIQSAYAFALRNAEPINDLAWQELEKGENSAIEIVSYAVEMAVLKRDAREETMRDMMEEIEREERNESQRHK